MKSLSFIGVHRCLSVVQKAFSNHRCPPMHTDKRLKKAWMKSLESIIGFPSLMTPFAEEY
jgi:hypothetical protein